MPNSDPSAPITMDALVQRVQWLEDGLRMHRHTGWDGSTSLLNAKISAATMANDSTLGNGTSTSGTLTMLLAANMGDVFIRANINAGDYSNAGAKTGFIFGLDDSDSDKAKFYFGSTTNYIKFDGTTLTVVGSLAVSSIDIPDATTANSFHVDTSGNSWWGANVASGLANANASVTAAGVAVFKSVTLTTSVAISGIANNTSTDISLLEFSHNIAFTSASATQVNWSAGTIVLSNGRTFSISSGNTGAMAAANYIYLDTAVSTTVLQKTTTYSTAMGANKILIATAQNNTTAASVVPFGGGQPTLDGVGNIAALSITAASIAASTITAGKLSVSQLSAIVADLGTITAGSLNINSGQSSIDSSGNAIFKSIQIGGGTRQYTISNNGIFTFGDSSDGTVSMDGTNTFSFASKSGNNYTLTRTVNCTDMTIATGCTLNPAGYFIYGQGTLTLSGTGKILRNGNNGTSGTTGATVATGGAALADGYLKGSVAGGDGGRGGDYGGGSESAENGTAGANTSNSIGSNGSAAGAGGKGDGGAGNIAGTAGAGGTATAANVALRSNWNLSVMLDIGASGATVKYDNSAGAGGGGGGGRSSAGGPARGGNGGGGGSAGGIIVIFFRAITIGASAKIQANGGNGGNGGNGTLSGATAGGGAGGGGGGNGGQIILGYNTLSNSGAVEVLAGTQGTKGTKGGLDAADGNDGIVGTAGTYWQFQLSL